MRTIKPQAGNRYSLASLRRLAMSIQLIAIMSLAGTASATDPKLYEDALKRVNQHAENLHGAMSLFDQQKAVELDEEGLSNLADALIDGSVSAYHDTDDKDLQAASNEVTRLAEDILQTMVVYARLANNATGGISNHVANAKDKSTPDHVVDSETHLSNPHEELKSTWNKFGGRLEGSVFELDAFLKNELGEVVTAQRRDLKEQKTLTARAERQRLHSLAITELPSIMSTAMDQAHNILTGYRDPQDRVHRRNFVQYGDRGKSRRVK